MFVRAGGRKIAEYRSGATRFFHDNHLGTPTVETTVTGAEAARWEHYPYGEQWTSSGSSANEHRYTGHMRDAESANDYAGARHYANGDGRWLSVDPIRGRPGDPQSLNRYGYALSDPVNYVDRDGRSPLAVCKGVLLDPETEEIAYYTNCRWELENPEEALPQVQQVSREAGGQLLDPVAVHLALNKRLRGEVRSFLTSEAGKECNKEFEKLAGANYLAKLSAMTYYDVTQSSVYQDFQVQSVAHGLRQENGELWGGTLRDYMNRSSSGFATMLSGFINGRHVITGNALLDDRFFDAVYLSEHNLTQGFAATHEFLHFATQLGDEGAAEALGISYASHTEASLGITRWLQNGCKKEQ